MRVEDDGHGISSDEVAATFGRIGGSWKSLSEKSKNGKRCLHGKLGEGRLRAFALGSRVSWISISDNTIGQREQITITGSRSNRDLAAKIDAAFDKRMAGRDQEIADLMVNRVKLEGESDKLLAAHFTDAIGLPTLKRHQDRIRAGLADVNRKLVEHDEHHTGGRAFLHDSLWLLTDAHHAYARSGDADRRLRNKRSTPA